MAKYWEGEYDINTDWGGDESTGNLPLPGSAVQKVVKDKFKELSDGKVGYIYKNETESKVYFSASKEDYEEGKYMGAVDSVARYSMDVIGDSNNKTIFLSNADKKEFVWYFKTVENSNGSLYTENVTVEYTIKNESESKPTFYSTVLDANADVKNENYTKVVMNLDEYLSNGTSVLSIVVKGLKTKQERTLQTKISIITLDMEDATDFSKPFENNFIATTDITCTKGQDYFYEYRIDEQGEFIFDEVGKTGKGTKDTVNYTVNLGNLPDGKHVFEYRIFIKIDSDTEPYYTGTQRIEFIKGPKVTFNEPQILVFSSYNKGESIKSEDGNLVINGVSQYVPYTMKYAVYNSDTTSTYLNFYEVTEKGESAPITDTVFNNVFAEYDIQSIESGIKKVKIITKDIDENITNGDGRIIYFNISESTLGIDIYETNLRIDFSSVGKSNNSVDKNTWVSNVNIGGAKYKNNASFNETYDWSQGWTENGLVVSEGCEVTFDYAPFPHQKDQASAEEANEYVGGMRAYTFEIEFMTQNVTNEDAVVCDMMDETEDGKCGLLITGSQIKFTTPNGESVSTRFKSEEMNRATIIVRPKESSSGTFKGLVELYINGVLSNIAKYTEKEKFEVFGRDELGTAISKNLSFKGAAGADIVIKYIRAYNGAMDADDVVNNYILYRTDSKQMLNLYNKNNVINESGVITPESMIKLGNIPVLIFIGRTKENELASPDGNEGDGEGNCDEEYKKADIIVNGDNWYQTLENTTDKKRSVDMDVIYYNPLNKTKNFKFINAYITPQGTSSMYYPKKNYRIYTQKNKDTRCFFSNDSAGVLEFDDMMRWDFGEKEEDRKWEKWRGKKNYKKRKYSFKDYDSKGSLNAQPVKCWCLKADFAETSSSHNTGVARLWGDTLKNSSVQLGDKQVPVFKTNAQATTEANYINNREKMPDVRTTIDGFPIVVFGAKSYSDEIVFLGQYNFNNDKSTESVFGFCDIDDEKVLKDQGKNTITEEVTEVEHTLDDMLDQYMTCVETLDNGNALANFSTMNSYKSFSNDESGKTSLEKLQEEYPSLLEEYFEEGGQYYNEDNKDYNANDPNSPLFYRKSFENEEGEIKYIYYARLTFDELWEDAFEFRYPEIPEKPDKADYQDEHSNWKEGGEEKYNKDVKEYDEEILPYWKNTHLKPFKHFAEWVYSTRWCDVDGNILSDITPEEAAIRKEKFSKEKWEHLDVWKMAAYYIYVMRFGAVDQVVKNSMLTSEGPFASDSQGNKGGYWDTTDVTGPEYGKYYKWYYINYDNDTVMGVKNDGSLAYGPEITRRMKEGSGTTASYIYAGSTSTLWNNLDADDDFQYIVRIADQGLSQTMTYKKAIEMFDVEQVGKWCERIYNKDAEYKYINPYVADWSYEELGGTDDKAENFTDKLFMLQGSRTAHRRWWLSKRFSLFDGKWGSGDFPTKYIEVKCDYGSIGDTFSAVAGSNAYFGYQINNKTFGSPEGGVTEEYKANSTINWKLFKNIQIGDPIAIYGSTDMLELNLMGLSKNLSSVLFYFGKNTDITNKLERLYLSVPDELMLAKSSYEIYSDDEKGTVNGKTGFEKLKLEYPELNESDFEEGGKYPTSDVELDATDNNSPKFYRTSVESEEGDIVYIYFAKVSDGIRNYSCKTFAFDALDKLQDLKMAGYMSIPSIDLSKNKFINSVDVRYSNMGSVTFAEGARIKEFYASTALTELSFTRCNNLKLENIKIDSVLLEDNGGVNLNKIMIDNSDGLNHDSNNFKPFILKWIKGGLGYKENSNRELTLRGLKWKNITIKDIETILTFKNGDESGRNKAKSCEISGIFEMSADNLSRDDIKMIEKFEKETGVNIRIPFPNILINVPEEIVAGDVIEITSEIFSDSETEINASIEYSFLVESSDGPLMDYHDGKRYTRIDASEVRDGDVMLNKNEITNTATLISNENILGEDTKALIGVILSYNGITKFDIAPIVIKDPTYATSGVIEGLASLNESGHTYEYNLILTSNKGGAPIGSVDVIWNIEGDGLDYISQSGISEDGLTLFITTKNSLPDLEVLASEIKITTEIKNYSGSGYPDFTIEKDLLVLNETVILTHVSNPVVMKACYDNQLTSSNNFMTKDEASSVEDIGSIFTDLSSTDDWSFDEFRYFNNPKLTKLDNRAFANTRLTSIVLPENITTLGEGVFENCKKLKNVEINNNITTISKKTFLNCSSLEKFILPDNVYVIEANAFGGTGFVNILFNNGETDINKTLYLSEYAKLHTIANDAFETDTWKIKSEKIESTNILNEVSLPKDLVLAIDKYNFLLSPNLSKINLISNIEDTNLLIENNILYASSDKTVIVRAIPSVVYGYVDTIELTNTTTVFDFAFYNCNSIKKVIFGESLEGYGLGTGAFYNSKVEEIDLSNSKKLNILQDFTFYDAINLNDIKLPMNGRLAALCGNLFVNNTKLTSLELPDTILTIRGRVKDSDNLTSSFGGNYSYTIKNCGIEEFKLPESLINCGMYFINSCSNLKKFIYSRYFILDSVYSLVNDCSNLKEVILPIFSTTVKDKAWFVCKNGKVISGPFNSEAEAGSKLNNYNDSKPTNYSAEFTIIEKNVNEDLIVNANFYIKGRITTFENCPNISKFTFGTEDNHKIMTTEDEGVSVVRVGAMDKATGLIIPCNKALVKTVYDVINYQINNDIVEVENGAFAHCRNLTGITLPNTLTKIGEGAFAYTSSLKNVNIPSGINILSKELFYGSGIENITLPIINVVSEYAFSESNLKNIILNDIKNIGDHAFFKCSNLKHVELLNNEELITINRFAFVDCLMLSTIVTTAINAPELLTSTGKTSIGVFDFHPFGYNDSNYVGKSITTEKKLFVPYNSNGYNNEKWLKPLLDTKLSNFTKTYLQLDENVIVRSDILNNYGIVYLKRESNNSIESIAITNSKLTWNLKNQDGEVITEVFDNEIIRVYSDSACTNEIGRFVAHYKQTEYDLGSSQVLGSSDISLFNSNLFTDEVETNKQNIEMANITKEEYEILQAKINQLMKLLTKK